MSLNWALFTLKGAASRLSHVHADMWRHPKLGAAARLLEEAVEDLQQQQAVDRLLRARFRASLLPGTGAVCVVWKDAPLDGGIRRVIQVAGEHQGKRGYEAFVRLNDGVEIWRSWHTALEGARTSLQTYALISLRDPLVFPKHGDVWVHPEHGVRLVRFLFIEEETLMARYLTSHALDSWKGCGRGSSPVSDFSQGWHYVCHADSRTSAVSVTLGLSRQIQGRTEFRNSACLLPRTDLSSIKLASENPDPNPWVFSHTLPANAFVDLPTEWNGL